MIFFRTISTNTILIYFYIILYNKFHKSSIFMGTILLVFFTGWYLVHGEPRLMRRTITVGTQGLYWFRPPTKQVKSYVKLLLLYSCILARLWLQCSYAYERWDDYNMSIASYLYPGWTCLRAKESCPSRSLGANRRYPSLNRVVVGRPVSSDPESMPSKSCSRDTQGYGINISPELVCQCNLPAYWCLA